MQKTPPEYLMTTTRRMAQEDPFFTHTPFDQVKRPRPHHGVTSSPQHGSLPAWMDVRLGTFGTLGTRPLEVPTGEIPLAWVFFGLTGSRYNPHNPRVKIVTPEHRTHRKVQHS